MKKLLILWAVVFFISCKENGKNKAQGPFLYKLPKATIIKPDELVCTPDSLGALLLKDLPVKSLEKVIMDTVIDSKDKFMKSFISLNKMVTKEIIVSPIEANLAFNTLNGKVINPTLRSTKGAGTLTGVNTSWFYFGAENGMPGSTVNCFFEDTLQRLWLGTDGGLAIYEGLNIQTFSTSNGLNHNYVTALAFADGAYYIGTKGGLNILGDSIYSISLKQVKGIETEEVTCLFAAKDTLLIGTNSGLIIKVENNIFSFNQLNGLPGNHVREITRINKGQWLISTLDGGSFIISAKSGNHFLIEKFSAPIDQVYCHSMNEQGDIFFGVLNIGIIQLHKDSFFQIVDREEKIKRMLITDIECKDRDIYCSSFGGGFYSLSGKGEIISWSNELKVQAAALSNVIRCNEDGEILVGGAGGLLKQNINISVLKKDHGLKTTVPTAVAYGKEEDLYISTIRGGLQWMKNGWRKTITTENGLSSNNIPFIFHGNSGKILVSTSGNGLDIIDGNNIYNLKQIGEIKLTNVNCAIEDKKNRIWIGSNEDGLFLWEQGKVYHFNAGHWLKNKSVYSLKELPDGSIAIGTNGDGLLVWKENRMLRYSEKQGLKSGVVYPVVEEEGILLAGTYGSGLFLINGREIINLTDSSGLPDNSILSITKVNRNKFLLGTAKGLVTMQLFPFHLSVLTKKEGLFFDDFQALAADYITSQDEISLASGDVLLTLSGVNKEKKIKCNPVISSVVVNGKILYNSIEASTLGSGKKPTNEIKYSDNKVKINFGYVGTKMESQEMEIAFRLLGDNADWTYAENISQYEFNNLVEGNYQFEYTIKDISGYWRNPVSFSFTVLPPWYRSIYAYAAYSLLFFGSLFGFARLRNKQLIEKNLQLERVVEERTKEVVKQKDEIAESKKVVELQNFQLEEKNHEIIQSINYAKHLQNAILPSRNLIDQCLADYFLLYLPKDIVAGDFYWFEKLEVKDEEFLFFAVADCTGHGVPGAMVSVVCSNALNRALLEFNLLEPGLILDKVRDLVIETFKKSAEEVKDGMDISLVRYNISKKEIKWAGANNPLWIIKLSEGEITEVKADKQPVGLHFDPKPFTTHSFTLNAGDCFYLISDGYADQFGGPAGKKFKSAVFKQLLKDHHAMNMRLQEEKVKLAFETWKQGFEQVDDVSVMGVKV